MSSIVFSGLYKLSVDERIELLERADLLSERDAEMLRGINPLLERKSADQLIENVIGVFGLPFAIAPNFLINGKDYIIPLVMEEPSVVAGLSGAAKLIKESGGFYAETNDSRLIGQVQIENVLDTKKTIMLINEAKEEILNLANQLHPRLLERGGGAVDIEILQSNVVGYESILTVHLFVNTCDAMGANIVNSMCENIAPLLEKISEGRVLLCILSNLSDKSLVTARVKIDRSILHSDSSKNIKIRDDIVKANNFANMNEHRAATHNKGIMNGIDAVAIATGNDWRAIEAGAHAFAARDGHYRSLTNWYVNDYEELIGEIILPLKVGIIGGSISVNPGARIGLKVAGVKNSQELGLLMAATGLAQNFAALRTLVSTGIQKGHMSLHARSVVSSIGVSDHNFKKVVNKLVESGQIKTWKAREIKEDLDLKKLSKFIPMGKAHGKIILFGEHAAVYGKTALAIPVKDAVIVQVMENNKGVIIDAPDWNLFSDFQLKEFRNEGLGLVIREVLTYFGMKEKSISIKVLSKIPLGGGLGSSAAFAVALIRAIAKFLNKRLSDSDINSLSFKCEQLTHGNPSGIDNYIATYGQSVIFSKDKAPSIINSSLEKLPLIVVSSDERVSTKTMIDRVARRYKKNSFYYDRIFNEMHEISLAGSKFLIENDFDRLGSLMNISHGLLNAIEVSTPNIERMIKTARDAGAIGAKLTGAGGGGSIIALCPEKIDLVRKKLLMSGYNVMDINHETLIDG